LGQSADVRVESGRVEGAHRREYLLVRFHADAAAVRLGLLSVREGKGGECEGDESGCAGNFHWPLKRGSDWRLLKRREIAALPASAFIADSARRETAFAANTQTLTGDLRGVKELKNGTDRA
jgi:hypothetical protein